MVRAPCCEKMGLKKGPWTPEEDKILISHIQKYGHGNWRALPKQSGLSRCGKSCRLRWTNYLRPDIKRGNFTNEEEQTIIKLHQIMGNRWSAIAAKLPGRTDNEIKNVWHTHLKKRLVNKYYSEFDQNSLSYSSSTMSPQQSFSDFSSVTHDSSNFNPSLNREANNINQIKDEEEEEEEEEDMDSFEIDESFWSEELSSSADENCSVMSNFIINSTDDQSQQLQFPPSDPIQPFFDYDLDYWYSLFIGAGGLPEF